MIIFASVNERIVRIVFILAILACNSCGTLSRAPKVAGQPTLADSVWVFSQSRPEGFTIDIRSWKEPREGISVAYQQTQNRHDREDLDYVVSHAKEHDGFIGGWLNSEDGLYYFDSVRLFPEDSLSAAINFGKANYQDAVYKLSSKQEIRLIEDVEFVSPTSLIPGIAIKIPEGTHIIEAIVFFEKVKGVTAVERDNIYHLIEPVKPRLEVM